MAFGRFSELREIDGKLDIILDRQVRIEKVVTQMASGIAELDAALTALDTQISSSTAAILAAVNDIIAHLPPTVDLSAEIARIQAEAAAIKTASDQVQALDVQPAPGPSPGPPPIP